MEVVRLTPGKRDGRVPRTVVALGFFDGVHIGHRRLLESVVGRSRESGAIPSVFTFSDGERTFKPKTARLTDFDTKLALFAACGIERVYTADFPDYSGLSPEAFVSDVLIGTLGCEIAVCGFNFRFGKGAAGDSARLAELMKAAGRNAEIIPPTELAGKVVSSSGIRAALADGDASLAGAMLGHPYTLSGVVSHGRGYGHTEGVPTVNLAFPPHLAVPRHGVYAAVVTLPDGSTYDAVSNVGTRPTFGGEGVNCETFLLGYGGGELYGVTITVGFLRFIRPETKFDSPDALYRQIARDIESVKTKR